MASRIASPRGQRDLDLAIEDKSQLVEGVVIHRVADDDRQFAVGFGQRDGNVFAGDGLGHQFHHRRGDRDLVQVDEVQAVLFGHCPHHFLARGIAQLCHCLGQADARFGHHLLGFGELVRADNTLPDKDFRVITLAFGSHIIPCKVSTVPYIYPA